MTYNHASIISEHLDSVKFQVINFGKGKRIFFTIVDDCSTDDNKMIILEWISKNRENFDWIDFINNEVNLGIKHNFLSTIKYIRSSRYKILAGDDLYNERNNIFDYMDYCKDKNLVFSKYLIFGKSKQSDRFYNRIRFLFNHKILCRRIIKSLNIFPAPSSYISLQYLKDNEYLEFLNNSIETYEDLPSWKFILLKKKDWFHLYPHHTVDYRPAYGRSLTKNNILISRNKSITLADINLMRVILVFLDLIFTLNNTKFYFKKKPN